MPPLRGGSGLPQADAKREWLVRLHHVRRPVLSARRASSSGHLQAVRNRRNQLSLQCDDRDVRLELRISEVVKCVE
eukprot:2849866-Prymnesium_polylepis.1